MAYPGWVRAPPVNPTQPFWTRCRVIRNSRLAFAYRMLLIAACLYAILVYSGVLAGRFNPQIFVYFTILSVLLAFVFFNALVLASLRARPGEESRLLHALAHFKGGVTMAVTITMGVYHFVLAPVIFDMAGYRPFSFNDIIVHYMIPVMVIVDWLLFDPKPTTTAADPVKWLGIPVAYALFVGIRAQLGGALRGSGSQYPYFFLDIDALGAGRVALNAVLLLLGFLALGYVLLGIDRLLGRKQHG